MHEPTRSSSSVPRSRPSFSTVLQPNAAIRLRGGAIRNAVKSAMSRLGAPAEHDGAETSKSMFLKEASLYTCFLLAGWVDATPGALLPAIRQHWNLSFVLVSLLFVGTFFGCIIASSSVSPLMDKLGFGKIIAGAAALSMVFPIVFLTMPPFPVLIVAMMFNGMANSTLDSMVNVWISQRPKADVRLGFLHFLYGVGALSSPLAAIPFLHEGRKGIAFQYFFCVSLALALIVTILVTVAFRLQRDEHVEGPSHPLDTTSSIELQPPTTNTTTTLAHHENKHNTDKSDAASATTLHAAIDLMPTSAHSDSVSASASGSVSHAQPAHNNDAKTGYHKLLAVVKQRKVQLLALFTGIYVGTEVTIGGWSSTYLIDVRNQETSANALVSGFWAGIAFGRILLIPVTAWLGEELAIFVYLLCAVGLQILVWLVPNIIANAVALALMGLFLGPAFPAMIRVAQKTIRPRAHLTAAISFISSFSAAGMAALPFIVGIASQAAPEGIKVLPPILVGLLALQIGLWSASNKDYFVRRFIKRQPDVNVEEHDRLD